MNDVELKDVVTGIFKNQGIPVYVLVWRSSGTARGDFNAPMVITADGTVYRLVRSREKGFFHTTFIFTVQTPDRTVLTLEASGDWLTKASQPSFFDWLDHVNHLDAQCGPVPVPGWFFASGLWDKNPCKLSGPS